MFLQRCEIKQHHVEKLHFTVLKNCNSRFNPDFYSRIESLHKGFTDVADFQDLVVCFRIESLFQKSDQILQNLSKLDYLP